MTTSDNNSVYAQLNVIGLMSGTSTDGIDAAAVSIQMSTDPLKLVECHVLATSSTQFEPSVRNQLLDLVTQPQVTLENVCKFNMQMGDMLADSALVLLNQLEKQGIIIDLIASHGHTVYHSPPSKEYSGSTLQIGQPAVIAERTGIDVIGDFRPRDMAAGGQGAPLIIFADQLLFQDSKNSRGILNLGGIANISIIPSAKLASQHPYAFDTGPGNMIIDACTQALFEQPFDKDGQIASHGKVNPDLLEQLMAHPFLQQSPPKSTGREAFGIQFTQALLDIWKEKLPPEDIVASVTQFTLETLLLAINNHILPQTAIKELIVGGGGVKNTTLMERLTARMSEMEITVKRHEDFGLDSQYKEAIAFALLGYAHKMNIPNTIPQSTGARHPVVMGGFWPGTPKATL